MAKAKVTCPICSTPMPGDWSEYPEYPFCSARCKMIDLGRWLGEDYRVPDRNNQDQSSEVRDHEE